MRAGAYHARRMSTLDLDPRLSAIVAQDYPRFSDAEYTRRHRLLGDAMARSGVDHLLVVTDHRAGSGPQWLTGWPGTSEAYVIFRPDASMSMTVEWVNHVALARRIARGVEVEWGEHRGIEKAIAALQRRGANHVGVVGPLIVPKWRRLEAHFQVTSLESEYVRLRTIKSDEEIEWMRIGAALSDLGLDALVSETRPGLTERELGNIVERAYVGHGGATLIHYIGATSMAAPDIYVPPQYASTRRVRAGDIVVCELSAIWGWDYPGQVLRTFTVDAEPTALYRDLHAAAEAAFDAITSVVRAGATARELFAATSVIEESGYTVCDDVVHGFGGGYLQPVLGSRSRPGGPPVPDLALEENMTLVVQPNVITPDRTAGVQTGELIRVTRNGYERLHRARRGLFRAGDSTRR
jgi:Xaa-Pro aminopeptidase